MPDTVTSEAVLRSIKGLRADINQLKHSYALASPCHCPPKSSPEDGQPASDSLARQIISLLSFACSLNTVHALAFFICLLLAKRKLNQFVADAQRRLEALASASLEGVKSSLGHALQLTSQPLLQLVGNCDDAFRNLGLTEFAQTFDQAAKVYFASAGHKHV